MTKFKTISEDIQNQLKNINYEGDLGDIGNEIGIVIAKYFDNEDYGNDKQSFISGLEHGISLTDGTHG